MDPPPPPPSYYKPLHAPSKPITSCGACRHMRRRCTPDCIFAPYFPSNQPEKYARAHRLFGNSTIAHYLQAAGPDRRDDAAAAIIYEANARARDPVGGTRRIVLELMRSVQAADAELRLVLDCIRMTRANRLAFAPPPYPRR